MSPKEEVLYQQIAQLWLACSRAIWNVGPGESISKRLQIKPWETEDASVLEAWRDITAPENLHGLELWYRSDVQNPTAREYSKKALAECRNRIEKSRRNETLR